MNTKAKSPGLTLRYLLRVLFLGTLLGILMFVVYVAVAVIQAS